MPARRIFSTVATAAAAILLAACGTSSDSHGDAASGDSSCAAGDLQTTSEGTLTIATGEPAFPPWVLDDDPESKQGFEAAVAYAVAEQLGYEDSDVTWVRTTFDSAIAPGPKDFDFNLQQFSISDERKQAVDFSSGYYTVSQVVVSYAGSPIDGATSLAELANARFGAAVGTTSLDAIEEQIQPAASPSVFNDNAAGVAALKNKQIDGFVVDLPTGFYLANVEVEGGVLVGQLPDPGENPEEFGLLLEKGSPITGCVTDAVDALRSDGTLEELQQEWLDQGGAPTLE
ncbi:MAG TPA: ABC transporter substrate-binding protein [Actinomycetes bacterium]|nr:ABC transporter substrate-binding protein [Actinomycetes bacterium]